MKITVQSEGGLAFMPGLSRPVTVDTETLPLALQQEIAALLEQARFFELTSETPSSHSRDAKLHKITISRSPLPAHSIQRQDPLPAPLAALLNLIRRSGLRGTQNTLT